MVAMLVGIGVLVAVCLVVVLVVSQLFRKVEQGKALIVSKLRKVDVTFTGQVVLPVLHKAEVMDISLKTIEITRSGRDGLICQGNGSELAFPQAALGEHVKATVLLGSLVSALLAVLLPRRRNRLYRRLYEEENTDADADGIPDIYRQAAPPPAGPDRADGASG